MKYRILRSAWSLLSVAAISAASIGVVLADVPAPDDPRHTQQGTDWSFILMGAIAAFLGAILFLWLGRKLFKRS